MKDQIFRIWDRFGESNSCVSLNSGLFGHHSGRPHVHQPLAKKRSLKVKTDGFPQQILHALRGLHCKK